MRPITRQHYADKVDAWIGKGQIIVLTGQRRVGKSYILKDFVERHKAEPQTNFIYINKERKKFDAIKTHEQLNAYIDGHMVEDAHNFILIDEVQEIECWEKSVRSYRMEDDTDIIITGSNSKMLSSELGTLIGGRYQEIYIQSLSYQEFLLFHGLEESDEALWKYLNYGGLPGLMQIGLDDEDLVWDYIKGVYHTVMLKDIVEKNSIRNVAFLNTLLRYFADTIGKLNSLNNISKFMKSQGQDVAVKSIASYLGYFKDAYLLSTVDRFDIHGKKLLESNEKLYFGDIGLRNLIAGGERQGDMEKILENVVYQQLLRMGYTVNVGQLRVGEVDFVCTKSNERIYVQVTYLIASEETEDREFGRLENIQDNYPKYVISMTPLVKKSDRQGIIHMGLREFLRNGF
ncbi:MAG: ATP-binding protein [Bacteroidaceae bacterium]|nr:ATP-binding protein [Bacteroidaceae bacterium]MBQ4521228.1 ATP-binding protein [Bacteroidaceae bacterium]MBQ4621715.1 ATP-binding protein [Bacteroidaceae bacterium]